MNRPSADWSATVTNLEKTMCVHCAAMMPGLRAGGRGSVVARMSGDERKTRHAALNAGEWSGIRLAS